MWYSSLRSESTVQCELWTAECEWVTLPLSVRVSSKTSENQGFFSSQGTFQKTGL